MSQHRKQSGVGRFSCREVRNWDNSKRKLSFFFFCRSVKSSLVCVRMSDLFRKISPIHKHSETSAVETSGITSCSLPRNCSDRASTAGLAGIKFAALTKRTKPSPQSPVRKPHVGSVIGSFYPMWCTAAVSGSFPTLQYTITPEKHREKSRTARHNRAAQAEITTPYAVPRFHGRYCRVNSLRGQGEGERNL